MISSIVDRGLPSRATSAILCGVLWFAAAGAKPAHAENLAEAIAYAYEANPGINAQRASLRALDESYVQARAGYGLTASVTAGHTYERLDRDKAREQEANTDSVGLTVTQPLYTGGRVRARTNAAEARILAGREQLRRAEMDLLQRVVTAYIAVRRDEEILRINQDTAAVLQQQFNDTTAKFRVQQVTRTDLAQAEGRLANAQTAVINAQGALQSSRARYLGVVGRHPGTLEPPPELEGLPKDIDQALDLAEEKSPVLLNALYNEDASRARIAEARAGRRPSVTARADLRHAPFLPYDRAIYDDTFTASIQLSQPLYTSGQINSVIRQALAENNRDRLTVEDTRLILIQNVIDAWSQLDSARRALETLRREVAANQTAFLGVREEERFALRTTLDILNASSELQNAQANLLRAAAAEYIGRTQVLAIIGELDPRLFAPGTKVYDPAKNFRSVRNVGMTPFEIPVRVIEIVTSPGLERRKPTRVLEIDVPAPALAPLPATPQPTTPPQSISDILEKARRQAIEAAKRSPVPVAGEPPK